MATHAAPATRLERLADMAAWLRLYAPYVLGHATLLAGLVVAAQLLAAAGWSWLAVAAFPWAASGQVLVVCWQAMRAPWDKLTGEVPDEMRGQPDP